jgi:hypothetical protein
VSVCKLTLLLAALAASSALGEDEAMEEEASASGLKLELTKGGNHLFAINGVIGAGSATVLFISGLTGGANQNLPLSGAAAVGMLALFLGGGLTAGHLLDPTPPMAWSSFFAGVGGAGIGLGLMVLNFRTTTVEAVMLAMAIGYLVGAGLDLAMPGRDSLSWKDFWLPMLVSVIPGAALIAIGSTTTAFRSIEFTTVVILYPLVSFLVTRGVLSVVRPFDPWFDDLQPPFFRAEPMISITPSGATVGLVATW